VSKADLYFLEPPIAHQYVAQDGSKFLKRRPYNDALSRVWEHYTTRTSDAAYTKWYSNIYPCMDSAETVPPPIGQLMGHLFRYCLHPYDDVADTARHSIEKVVQRFPILVTLYSPLVLPALTRTSLPENITMEDLLGQPALATEIFSQMESLMQPIDTDLNPIQSTQHLNSSTVIISY